ncbi:hypothetical protein GCM10009839_43540 [Catenulispora yoronensis]|uniref:Uncharacterized protein n=1 Tax=Catenulispora yoronensis TaxID=450799 RepID=A0ABP5FZY1_9ACTN
MSGPRPVQVDFQAVVRRWEEVDFEEMQVEFVPDDPEDLAFVDVMSEAVSVSNVAVKDIFGERPSQ